MDYLGLIENSFSIGSGGNGCPPESRLEFLSKSIFDFITDDSEMAKLFAGKAIEVCAAINDGKTYEYIKDAEQYKWYLLMCNMPFFADRLEWGGSIRGAWWNESPGKLIYLSSCGLWIGDEQCDETLTFKYGEWNKFISAAITFAGAVSGGSD